MIQSNKDLYHSVHEIISELKKEGHINFANKLEEALTISTVPSEVLGKLRMVLQELINTDFAEGFTQYEKIKTSLEYLNAIL